MVYSPLQTFPPKCNAIWEEWVVLLHPTSSDSPLPLTRSSSPHVRMVTPASENPYLLITEFETLEDQVLNHTTDPCCRHLFSNWGRAATKVTVMQQRELSPLSPSSQEGCNIWRRHVPSSMLIENPREHPQILDSRKLLTLRKPTWRLDNKTLVVSSWACWKAVATRASLWQHRFCLNTQEAQAGFE